MKLACIDVGGTTIKRLCATAEKGAPVSSYGCDGYGFSPTGAKQGFEAIKGNIYASIEGLLAEFGCDAIAVSTAGTVDWDSGKVTYATDALPGFTGYDFRADIADRYGLPVRVVNDAAAAAIAEHFNGAYPDESEIVLTIGTGLGGAFVSGGKLDSDSVKDLRIGHVEYVRGGHSCKCGKRGCIEQYVSATAMRRDSGNGDLDAVFADKAAYGGQIDAFEEALRWITVKAFDMTGAAHAVIGGGVTEIAGWWDDFVQKLPPVYVKRVRKASLGNRAGALGAAYAALNGVFARQ